jgi:hypothetical protein
VVDRSHWSILRSPAGTVLKRVHASPTNSIWALPQIEIEIPPGPGPRQGWVAGRQHQVAELDGVLHKNFIRGCGSSQVGTDGRKEARIATTPEANRWGILLADRGEELPHGNQEPGERGMNGSHEGFSGDCDAGAIGSRLPRRSSRAQQNENSPMFRSGWCRTPSSAAGKPVLGELPRERREASAAPRQSRGAMDQESR